MMDKEIDALAKRAVDLAAAGVKVELVIDPRACRKCGSTEGYRYDGTPNWMNRWTCRGCGRHESR